MPPNTYGTVRQGQSFFQNGRNVGTVQFDARTGRRLGAGESTTLYDPNAPLTATDLTSNTPLTGTRIRPQSNAVGLEEFISGLRTPGLAENTSRAGEEYFNRLINKKGVNQLTNENYGEVDTAKKDLDEIQNQVRAKQLGLRREIESIQKNSGMTKEQAAAFAQEAQRKGTSELADLSVIEQAKLSNYSTMKEIADRKVSMELEVQQNEIEGLKFWYEENKEQLDKEDERVFNVMIKDRERALDQEASNLKTLTDTRLELLQSAAAQNAPNDVLLAIQRSQTPEDAIAAAGQYAGDILDRRYKLAQINKLDAERNTAISSLPPALQTRVQTIAGQFDNEQAVKAYQTSAEAIDAVRTAGTSPTDDISRVYAFAKVMDPNSVVREGEYKTVQDYSTALLQRAGLKTRRVFDNAGFLTPEAREFMLNTLDNRLASSKKAYDNIYSEYGRRINKITNQGDGLEYLTDYSRAFTENKATQNFNPLSNLFNGFTAQQLQQLINAL